MLVSKKNARQKKFKLRRKKLLKKKQLLEKKLISIKEAKKTAQKAIDAADKKRLFNELQKQEREYDFEKTEFGIASTNVDDEEREVITEEIKEET